MMNVPGITPWTAAYLFSMDWRIIVPAEALLAGKDLSGAREVRLRPGQPVEALLPEGRWQGKTLLSPQDILNAAQALTDHGLAARNRELAQGYAPLPGGGRMGVAGRMGENGLLEITSLCVRLPHEVRDAAAACYSLVKGKSTLIAGPPGSGKTTLLRDLIRRHGLDGYQVGVADERGEIAACQAGRPQLDVGPRCDVVTGGDKAQSLLLLLRALAPQVLATDEIGGGAEVDALAQALRWGVRILCTVHGGGAADLRPRLNPLLGPGGFEKIVLLRGVGEPPQVVGREDV